MLSNLSKYKIILGSNSPRRKELMAGLGIQFKVRIIKGIDESYPHTLVGQQIPIYIANKKADAYQQSIADDELIITADTIVYMPCEDGGGQVLGKPADANEAIRMLRLLSGKLHEVITGVAVVTKKKRTTFAVTSKVSFANLSDNEIYYYVNNYKPYDKAGAYGIQEWIGFIGVNGLIGSYFNVMGLPVQKLYEELKKW